MCYLIVPRILFPKKFISFAWQIQQKIGIMFMLTLVLFLNAGMVEKSSEYSFPNDVREDLEKELNAYLEMDGYSIPNNMVDHLIEKYHIIENVKCVFVKNTRITDSQVIVTPITARKYLDRLRMIQWVKRIQVSEIYVTYTEHKVGGLVSRIDIVEFDY